MCALLCPLPRWWFKRHSWTERCIDVVCSNWGKVRWIFLVDLADFTERGINRYLSSSVLWKICCDCFWPWIFGSTANTAEPQPCVHAGRTTKTWKRGAAPAQCSVHFGLETTSEWVKHSRSSAQTAVSVRSVGKMTLSLFSLCAHVLSSLLLNMAAPGIPDWRACVLVWSNPLQLDCNLSVHARSCKPRSECMFCSQR